MKNITRVLMMTGLAALEVIYAVANTGSIFMLLGLAASVMWGSVTHDWQYTRYMLAPTISLLLGGKLVYEAGTRFIGLSCETVFDEEVENRKAMEDYARIFARQERRHFRNTYNNTYSQSDKPQFDTDRILGLQESLKVMGIATNIKINEELIKKSYRSRARKLHPDMNAGRDTTKDMQKLNEAKELLENDFAYWNKYIGDVV